MSSISHGPHDMQARFADTLSVQIDLLSAQQQKLSQSGWLPVKSQAFYYIAHLYHEKRENSRLTNSQSGEYIPRTMREQLTEQRGPA